MIEAVAAGSEEAGLLEVDVGTPLLYVRRILNDAAGTPIEHYRSLYRGDRFQYMASGRVHPLDISATPYDDSLPDP
jgi:GntR family transcriptional regulator